MYTLKGKLTLQCTQYTAEQCKQSTLDCIKCYAVSPVLTKWGFTIYTLDSETNVWRIYSCLTLYMAV